MIQDTYLLYSDETNKEQSKTSKFFIYGVIFMPLERLFELHTMVNQVRKEYGFKRKDVFKFDTNSKPKYITSEIHRLAKDAVLIGSATLGLKFVANVVLHEIARRKSTDETIRWGANTILRAFQQFLNEKDALGICVVDRLPFKGYYNYLKDKFQDGLSYPTESRPLGRIIMFASSCQGASHVGSVTDIILGAFRFCVNDITCGTVTQDILPKVIRLMWYKRLGESVQLQNYGLIFRPLKVMETKFQKEYELLAARLIDTLKIKDSISTGIDKQKTIGITTYNTGTQPPLFVNKSHTQVLEHKEPSTTDIKPKK